MSIAAANLPGIAEMPDTLSARDFAGLRIAGLPATKGGIHRLRKLGGWRSHGHGNKLLIDVASLPAEIRDQVFARYTQLRAAMQPKPARARTPGRGRPSGTDWFTRHPDQADAVVAYLAQHQYAATTLRELLATSFDALPHLRVLQKYIARVEAEKVTLLTAMRDPDRAKSKHMLALGRMDGDATHAHQVWELDTTKADLMMDGGRKMILGLIDRYSRRVRFLVAPSESAQAVRALLFKAITEWGVVPGTIVVDNGSGYINATVKSACVLLGIAHKACPPGSPERKPFVERLFGTFTRQRAVLLDGFTGHNVADAQKLRGRARKISGRAEIIGSHTPEHLQTILDNWTAGVYETRVHGSLGMSPLARAMQSPIAATPAPRVDLLRQMLTAFVGNLIIGKRGLVWKRGRYWDAALAGWIGRPVHVRRDEDDLGALLVFDGDGNFITTAVNHMREGVSERDFAMAARIHQRALDKAQKAEARALIKTYSIDKARTEILRRDAEAAGKLLILPVAPPARKTAQKTPVHPRFSSAPAQIHSLAVASTSGRNIAELGPRVLRAEALIASASAGHDVDQDRLDWAKAFVTGSAYRAWKASQPKASQTQASQARSSQAKTSN